MELEKVYNLRIIEWSKRTDYCVTEIEDNRAVIQRNPLCGDEVTVLVRMDGDAVNSIQYRIRGCALAKASCAYLADRVRGLTKDQLLKEKDELTRFLKGDGNLSPGQPDIFEMFSPTRPKKSRHSCVLLPYDALLTFFDSLS